MEKLSNNKLQKTGGLLAIYAGFAYLAMIIYFLVILNYPSITEQSEKINMFIDNQTGFHIIYLLGYVVFGLALAVLSLSLYEKLKSSPALAKTATVYGIIWACLLIGSGMVTNRGITMAVQLYSTDPAQAITVWTAMEGIALGISFADGEILGGIWTLLVSIAAIKSGSFNKGINYLGLVVGVAGIASIVPAINAFGGTGVFGIGQLVWFVWLGILMIQDRQK